MALWAKILDSQGEAAKNIPLYTQNFPFEVRHCLANWIEDQPWDSINPDNVQHLTYAQNLFQAFLVEINRSISELTTQGVHFMPLTFRLSSSAKYFQERYGDNPLELVRMIQNCLQMEKNLIMGKAPPIDQLHVAAIKMDENDYYKAKLETLYTKTKESDIVLENIQQEQESFILNNQEGKKLTAQVKHYSTTYANPSTNNQNPYMGEFTKLKTNRDSLVKALEVKSQEIKEMRLHFAEGLLSTQKLLLELMSVIVNDELKNWKIKQKLAGNGVPFNDNLTYIQKWCERIADLAWKNKKQVKRLIHCQNQLNLPEHSQMIENLNSNICNILSSLVFDTFVIDRQPPQVLKTNTRFTASLRLLVGSKLNIQMTSPEVQAHIISEQQAAQIYAKKEEGIMSLAHMNQTSGEILNYTGTIEYDSPSNRLGVQFKNMQLKKIKRQEKKGSETVSDEKFCIIFKSSFKLAGGDLNMNVWVLSLPIVVIVHGNQEANACASILWDNAFSDFVREPFKIWNEVPWPKLAEMLNYKFNSMVGKSLTEPNLAYLYTKIMTNPEDHHHHTTITISQFNKEHIQNRPFTFWQWFYHICLVVKDCLRPHWLDNTIIGFISRNNAHDMLMKTVRNTFLLRFSDSTLGGVTIAWLDINTALGPERLDVWNLKPFTSKDFAIRSLADRIKDLSHLQLLYPDIPKDVAFGKYYTCPETETIQIKDGYVGTVLVTTTALPAEQQNNAPHPMASGSADSTQKASPQSTILMPENETTNPFEELWDTQADDILTNIDLDNIHMNFFPNHHPTGAINIKEETNSHFSNS